MGDFKDPNKVTAAAKGIHEAGFTKLTFIHPTGSRLRKSNGYAENKPSKVCACGALFGLASALPFSGGQVHLNTNLTSVANRSLHCNSEHRVFRLTVLCTGLTVFSLCSVIFAVFRTGTPNISTIQVFKLRPMITSVLYWKQTTRALRLKQHKHCLLNLVRQMFVSSTKLLNTTNFPPKLRTIQSWLQTNANLAFGRLWELSYSPFFLGGITLR